MVLQLIRRLIKQIIAVHPLAKPQSDQSGKHTLKPSGVQPDQPRVHEPADDPRNRNELTDQGQGQTVASHAAMLQLPVSTFSAAREVLGTPQQRGEVSATPKRQEVSTMPRHQQQGEMPVAPQKKSKQRSMCGSSYYDLPLIASLE